MGFKSSLVRRMSGLGCRRLGGPTAFSREIAPHKAHHQGAVDLSEEAAGER
jgi:hypothetical protein